MILKILTRTTGSGNVGQLLRYITKGKPEAQPFVFMHNIKGTTLEGIQREFEEIARGRIHTHARQVQVYHEILAYPKGSEAITTDMLYAAAREYAENRSPLGLVVAVPHTHDTEHQHIHFAVSATTLLGRANRISKENLRMLKEHLRDWHKEHYPHIHLPTFGKARISNNMYWHEKRGGPSYKDLIIQRFTSILENALSQEELQTTLAAEGMPIYYRGGKEYGINVNNQNFRFNTLGTSGAEIEIKMENNRKLKELSSFRECAESSRSILPNLEK